MKSLFALLLLIACSHAQAGERITPCRTDFVKTSTGIKSFEVHLVASDSKGYHELRIYKNEGPNRSELPAVPVYFQSKDRVSELISVETRQSVLAYRERVAPTREGIVIIEDGAETLQLDIVCYLL